MAQLPSRNRRGSRRLALSVVGGAVVLTASLVLGIGASGPGSKSAAALVQLGARATLSQGSVQLKLSGSVVASGQTIPLTGSGAANLSSRLDELDVAFSASGTAVQESMVSDGSNIYMSFKENGNDLISQLMPGKHWVGISMGTSPSANLGTSTPNILSQLQMLTQQGNVVVALGGSTIDGQAVTGYQVTIGRKAMVAASKRMLALSGASAQSEQTILKSISTTSPPVLKIWIGADNLLRRESVSVDATSLGAPVSTNMVVDFVNYGAPVSVAIPATNDVGSYSAFLAALSQSSTSLG